MKEKKIKEIKNKLHNDLLAFESDLSRLTVRNHNKCMKYVYKLHKLVDKVYKEYDE